MKILLSMITREIIFSLTKIHYISSIYFSSQVTAMLIHFRSLVTDSIDLANSHKNVLDGELLWKFLHLSVLEKNEMAKRIGTSVEQVTLYCGVFVIV